MKNSKKATSILEAMIITMIISMWVVWMYSIYINSNNLIDSLANRIQAIQMAREWIEAVTNIRDTNWQQLWADYYNCWNTYNYNSACVWDHEWTDTDIYNNSWGYIVYSDTNNKWVLDNFSNTDVYGSWNYITNYLVWLDANGFYTQNSIVENIKPQFTREIKIDYINTSWATINTNDEKIRVTSLVQWKDSASKNIHKVEFDTILTNRKNKKEF